MIVRFWGVPSEILKIWRAIHASMNCFKYHFSSRAVKTYLYEDLSFMNLSLSIHRTENLVYSIDKIMPQARFLMQIEWWFWIIAGFSLIGLDLIIPSFTIIWFGVGALVVGALSCLLAGFPLAGQIAFWLLISACFSVMWIKYLRPKSDRTLAGLTKEEILGEAGVIISGTKDSKRRGIVKFRVTILGADEWSCYSSESLHVGDRVRVVDREGRILKVEII